MTLPIGIIPGLGLIGDFYGSTTLPIGIRPVLKLVRMPNGISVHLSIKTGIAYAKTQGNKNENPNPVTM